MQGGFDAWQAAGGPVEPKERDEAASERSRQHHREEAKSDPTTKKVAEEVAQAQKKLKDE